MKKTLLAMFLTAVMNNANAGAWLNVIGPGVDKSFFVGDYSFCEKIMIRESKKKTKRYSWISCSAKPLPSAQKIIMIPPK